MRRVVEASDGFDRMYQATTRSSVYRDAVRASSKDLPEWLVPFSIVDAPLLERIASELRVREGDAFLDLGCGAGGPALWVAARTGASLIGVDFSATAIEAAASLAQARKLTERARFIVADATATGLPDASVSAVMSVDALMFMDAERAANEIGRVVMPGGILVMTAAESLVEPFLPTIVRDYRPFFERAAFKTICHEEPDGHAELQLALYRALEDRADGLRAEIGVAAEALLEEARNGLSRAAQQTTRSRPVLFVAERLAE